MRFLRRIAGFLGFAKDESHDLKDDGSDDDVDDGDYNRVDTHLPRKGFSVPVQVPVDRAQVGPVIVPCTVGDGGVQEKREQHFGTEGVIYLLSAFLWFTTTGLRWYARRLRIDEDGDVADEFMDEILPETTSTLEVHQKLPMPRFELKYSTTPAKVRNQALTRDGKIQQFVEYQGRLLLA